MIKTPDGYEGIYFLADHRTMDAQSLICFLRDVIELYCSQKYEGVPAPKEMASYVEQLKKDLAYEMGSKAKERDEAYFQKLIDEMPEPIYNGIDGDGALKAEREKTGNPNARAAVNVSDSVDSALDIFHLEAEPTERLRNSRAAAYFPGESPAQGLRTYYRKEWE